MKNGLVVKDNALMNASYNLEVTEQRLILLAIISARETGQGITSDSKLEIHASDYAIQFNVAKETAYEALKNAVNNLFERQFSFREETKKALVLFDQGGLVELNILMTLRYLKSLFAPDVVPLITRLEEHFTSYQIKQIAQLTSKYAIRLYELLIAWRTTGKVPELELSEFRNRLGIGDSEYTAMNNFKSRVLEPSIKQINEHTDITVTYEQHKRGRTISGFSFRFKQKQEAKKIESKRDPDTADLFTKMTDAQRHMFSHKLSEMPEMSKYSQGTESYQQFAVRIAEMLLQPDKFRELYPLLEKAGFK